MEKKLKKKIFICLIISLISIGVISYHFKYKKNQTVKLENTEMTQIHKKENNEKDTEINQKDTEINQKDEKINELCQLAEDKLFGSENDKYDKVIQMTTEILNEYKDSYRAYSLRGIAYAYKMPEDLSFKENAFKDIDKSLELKEDYGYGRFNKALAYAILNDYNKALEWYDKALEIENYHWSYYGKGAIYAKLGDSENSVKWLKKAVELKPDIKELLKTEKEFDKVRENLKFKELIKD